MGRELLAPHGALTACSSSYLEHFSALSHCLHWKKNKKQKPTTQPSMLQRFINPSVSGWPQ